MIFDLALNYDRFRAVWQAALDASDMQHRLFPAEETLDLGQMSRRYEVRVEGGNRQSSSPFYVTAALSWTWDALQAARTTTTEEDFLTQALGRKRSDTDTEQPRLQVDIRLSATLPYDSPLPLPPAAAWRRWAADATTRLEHLLRSEGELQEDGSIWVLASRSEPEARLRCTPDGRLLLTGVELSAWEGVWLPRHWDDPDREPDEEPDAQLADLAGHVWQALQAWEHSVRYLQGD